MPPESETSSSRGPVIVLTGPTAAGKTPLALAIAQRFDAEIVNADSMQVYRFMDIGTAKPSREERALVPHHLFDIVDPDVNYSAGVYAENARAVVQQIHAAGKAVLLVGGTGLYIRAFLEGLIDSGGADPELRDRLEAEHARAVEQGDPDLLHRRLAALDPEAAARMHPNDLRRTIRALEIHSHCGELSSKVRDAHGFRTRPYPSLHFALDPGREIVTERIDARCEQMIERGLLQEVRRLQAKGFGPNLRSMQAIGYRHIMPVAEGRDTLANAVEAMKRDTRRFARRQRTWLRKVEQAIWIDPRRGDEIARRIGNFLDQYSGLV